MDKTMRARSIASAGSSAKRPGPYEFSAAHVSAAAVGRDLDPVIGIDQFSMRGPVFVPHPHAGFSAVTYLFEDRSRKRSNAIERAEWARSRPPRTPEGRS
jgi:redox-sensitive bicupin YhaK (pirin superfamily)